MKRLIIASVLAFAASFPVASLAQDSQSKPLRRFIIEREIPKIGSLTPVDFKGAAAKSNEALAKIGPDIQWVESYVAADKTFCVYLAKDEAAIRKHAEISGFPASKITEVKRTVDPTTAAD